MSNLKLTDVEKTYAGSVTVLEHINQIGRAHV